MYKINPGIPDHQRPLGFFQSPACRQSGRPPPIYAPLAELRQSTLNLVQGPSPCSGADLDTAVQDATTCRVRFDIRISLRPMTLHGNNGSQIRRSAHLLLRIKHRDAGWDLQCHVTHKHRSVGADGSRCQQHGSCQKGVNSHSR